jgi:serine/threonine protein kinase
MDHPNIAKVFDAGTTPDGLPYLVMEYVEGDPITNYCDKNRLTVRERLQLFIQVCEGVQHAHQKAIIHRDIKPSNVLVVDVDGKPSPRIIDFGVARAISSEGVGEQLVTRMGSLLGTPEYMSPEQANLLGGNVDTRADVYSLGVLLYELLVGVVPHANAGQPLGEILRRIREEPAQRPSVRFREKGMDSQVAQKRQLTPTELADALKGDLEVVVLKALKKNPESRYASPADLASDITRYLSFQPIVARPASFVYLTRKYIRRNWLTVLAALFSVILLIAFAIWQTIQIRRITEERDRADRVAQFMIDMFRISDPSESRSNRMTARDILERSSKEIETSLPKDGAMRAKLMSVMGRVYFGLGLYRQAELLFRHSLDSRRQVYGNGSVEAAQSMNDLAMALRFTGRLAEAKQLDLGALEIRKQKLGEHHSDTLQSMNSLAADMEREGAYGEARRLQENVYRADLRILGPEHVETLAAMRSLGELLFNEGRLHKAEGYARNTQQIQRRKFGPDHPDTLETTHLLAAILCDEGRYAEAEALFRELLFTRTKVLGSEHPDTLRSMKALAVPLNWQGKLEEAEKLDRQVVISEEKILAPDDPTLLQAISDLAHILADLGKYEESVQLARKVLESSSRSVGPKNPRTLFLKGALASILLQEGSLKEAEQLARETRDAQIEILGSNHTQTASTTYTLARIAARRGQADEAISLLQDAVDHGLARGYLLRLADEPNLKLLHNNSAFRSFMLSLEKRLASGLQ